MRLCQLVFASSTSKTVKDMSVKNRSWTTYLTWTSILSLILGILWLLQHKVYGSNTEIISLAAPKSTLHTGSLPHILLPDLHSNLSDPITSVIPYRDPMHQQIAWERFRNGTGHIILIHARKAGGSTMKSWLGSIKETLERYFNESDTEWTVEVQREEFYT